MNKIIKQNTELKATIDELLERQKGMEERLERMEDEKDIDKDFSRVINFLFIIYLYYNFIIYQCFNLLGNSE